MRQYLADLGRAAVRKWPKPLESLINSIQ